MNTKTCPLMLAWSEYCRFPRFKNIFSQSERMDGPTEPAQEGLRRLHHRIRRGRRDRRKVLTEGGLDVVMLEAGPRLDPDKDFKEHVWPYQLAHRGAGVGAKARKFGNEFHGAQWVLGDRRRAVYDSAGLIVPLVSVPD